MPETTTSVDPQAGASDQNTPQAGDVTSPDPQAGEGQESISLEEARKLRSEAKNLRSRLKNFEDAENKAKEAQLSEIELSKKQYSELQATHNEYVARMQARIVRYEVERQASKLGIIDPDAAARLLDPAELEYDDDGLPTNSEKLLKDLIKNKSYLASTPTPSSTSGTKSPALPAMNPGRTNIQPPTAPAQTRIPRMADIYAKNKK